MAASRLALAFLVCAWGKRRGDEPFHAKGRDGDWLRYEVNIDAGTYLVVVNEHWDCARKAEEFIALMNHWPSMWRPRRRSERARARRP